MTEDVAAAWTQLQAWGDALCAGSRMVACRWETVPTTDRVIDDVVRAFAGIALADWPHWYGTDLAAPDAAGNTFERNQCLRERLRAVSRRHVRVAGTWLRRAAEHCIRDEPPVDGEDNPELQAGQLSLAVCPGRLIIALAVSPAAPAAGAAALTAAAEWLHRVTEAPALVLVPTAWRGAAGLARLPLAQQWDGPAAEPAESPRTQAGTGGTLLPVGSTAQAAAAAETTGIAAATTAAGSCPEVGATPLPGRPHPNSDAERLLFDRIRADPELASLLAFNQPIGVDLGQSFRVDIVSTARRVAVEVDGPEHRGVSYKYIADCERDYRLMKHGYVVLRLPNELVLCNLDVAVARIRDILKCRAVVAS